MTLAERLDRLPLSAFHRRLTVSSGLGWMFDALDSGLVSFVLAVLAREWSLTASQTGWIGSAGMVGMFFGAIVSGTLADRWGRRTVFLATLVLFSIATGLLFAATAKGFGRGPLWMTVPLGIVFAFFVYVVFAKGLQLSLPAGPLERLF